MKLTLGNLSVIIVGQYLLNIAIFSTCAQPTLTYDYINNWENFQYSLTTTPRIQYFQLINRDSITDILATT